MKFCISSTSNNNNNKVDSLLQLNFNVYIDVDNREKARAKGKKTRRPVSLEEKHNNFIYNDGKKKGKSLAATKVKMSSSEKKGNRNS